MTSKRFSGAVASPPAFLKLVILVLFLLFCAFAFAQEPSPTQPQAANAASAPAPTIQDNSFLVEEAYNQEYGVVQHISSFVRYWNSKDWAYNFTQEWPGLHDPLHQFSHTLAAVNAGAFDSPGFGDTMLNYRYQVLGNGEANVAFAPRLSLLLPTGQSRYGRGFGGWGLQTNLPLSVVINKRFVTHWNAGATIVPRTKNSLGDTAATTGYNLGQSVIWLATSRFNVMNEIVWTGSESVVAHNRTQRQHGFFISPGVRWAYNLPRHLQIVPGIAAPLGVGPSSGERGLLLYLSFEHPFKSTEP